MSFNWDKQSFPTWKDKVQYELIEIRQQIAALAIQTKQARAATSGESGDSAGSAASKQGAITSDFEDVRTFISDADAQEEYEATLGKLTDMEAGPEKTGMSTEDIKHGTYFIQSATIAMRGYLMLLSEAGLSKDQKKMIAQLETAMMMVMKIAATVQIAAGVIKLAMSEGLDPRGWIQVIMSGGYAASAMAYGSKTMGGQS